MYRLIVWGGWACFPRPEFSHDLVTYDVITPFAARAILESIHWRPSVRWEIARLLVLAPGNVVRHPSSAAEQDGPQVLALRDVAYVIEASLRMVGELESARKHQRRFEHRVRSNQPFRRPYFGVRECPAQFRLLADGDPIPTCAPQLAGERDWGWLPYDQDNDRNRPTHFIRARSLDGVIAVPAPEQAALLG